MTNNTDKITTEAFVGRITARISRRRMLKGSGSAIATLGLLGVAGLGDGGIAQAEEAERVSVTSSNASLKPRIVLVHGAWADGTGWQHIIPLLERANYEVIAVQNPLSSLIDDVATTKRVIDAETQKGPVVAVGHSYGGAVITGAAAGNPNVKALVYIAAFAPEVGEPIGALLQQYPTALGTSLVGDMEGLAKQAHDYLFDEFESRLQHGSVAFRLDLQLAEEVIQSTIFRPSGLMIASG